MLSIAFVFSIRAQISVRIDFTKEEKKKKMDNLTRKI